MSLETALIDACKTGQRTVVKTAIKQGLNVAAIVDVEFGYSALHWAANNGYVDIVQVLLNRTKVPVDIRSNSETLRTPLLLAVQKGHHEIAEILLKAKADPNLQFNDVDATTVHAAARLNQFKALVHLLAHGASTNPPNCLMTPLMLACRHDHIEAARLMVVKGGARVNLPELDRIAWQPIHFAVESRSLDTVRLLVNYGADLRLRESSGATAFAFACELGDFDLVRFLIESSTDRAALLNSQDNYGDTPLMKAMKQRRSNHGVNLAKLLVGSGASVTAKNNANQSVLHYALAVRSASSARAELVSFLIKSGAVLDDYQLISDAYKLALGEEAVTIKGSTTSIVALNHRDTDKWGLLRILVLSGNTSQFAIKDSELVIAAMARLAHENDNDSNVSAFVDLVLTSRGTFKLDPAEVTAQLSDTSREFVQPWLARCFPPRLQAMARLAILNTLPRNYLIRIAAIEKHLSADVPSSLVDYLKFDHSL